MDAALDDVFIDEISFPATDGCALTGTLFLPRGAKRHAVLINSATARSIAVLPPISPIAAAPKGVFLQWADWVSSPRYLFDSKLPALENFAKFRGELRALCFSDDPWATRPAVELLTSGFTAIKPEVLTVKPSDVGAKAIGHFGFFRPEHRDTWRGVAEWIQGE